MADSDNESGGHNNSQANSEFSPREQDRFLPIANVSRIMKKALPANAKISKEAKETVQECVSEFISFITGEASDKCQREKRKTINGDDLLWAMTTLGFEEYVEPLKIYLQKFREMEGEKSAAMGGSGGGGSSASRAPDSSSSSAAVPSTASADGGFNGGSSAGGLYGGMNVMMQGQMYGGSPQVSAAYHQHQHQHHHPMGGMGRSTNLGGATGHGAAGPHGGAGRQGR